MYDNLIISHKDRTRIISEESYGKVFLSAARVLATILIDGFVAGIWKTERNKSDATLIIEPFVTLTADQHTTLQDEGLRLLRFIEEDAETYSIQFVEGGI